ncbi:MAG: hypothetical protein WC823_02495 [Parcubacteria group bacterium]|jgi:dolichol kinase
MLKEIIDFINEALLIPITYFAIAIIEVYILIYKPYIAMSIFGIIIGICLIAVSSVLLFNLFCGYVRIIHFFWKKARVLSPPTILGTKRDLSKESYRVHPLF